MPIRSLIKHVLFVFFIYGSILVSPVNAQEITCVALEDCVDKTKLLVTQSTPDNQINYNNIGQSFSQFNQKGFDALFEIMLTSEKFQQTSMLNSLNNLIRFWNKTDIEISQVQYDQLTDIWNTSPGYGAGNLINYSNIPQSHQFMLNALLDNDETKREWAKKIIESTGLGRPETSIDASLLPDILSLIETQNMGQSLVMSLLRMDSPDANEALLSLLETDLETDGELIFTYIFKELRSQNSTRINNYIKTMSFADTPKDLERALMIARFMAQDLVRDQRIFLQTDSSAKEDQDYWKTWYDETLSSHPERLIPAYVIFKLYETTIVNISIAERNILNNKKWRDYTIKNPEGRPSYLSEENLTAVIKRQTAHVSTFTSRLKDKTPFFIDNESRILEDYFQILDAVNIPIDDREHHTLKLPMPAVLDTIIQTPDIWVRRFQAYLKCDPYNDTSDLIRRLAQLDPANIKLKTCLLERLEQFDDMPKLLGTLSLITTHKRWRADPDIRAAIKSMREDHPFTKLRVAKIFALSDEPIPERFGFTRFVLNGVRRKRTEQLNEKRKYCDANQIGQIGKPNYMDEPLKLNKTHSGTFRIGKRIMTVRTPSGYLTGHNSGEFGGGLIYYPDEKSDGVVLHGENMISIIKTNTKGIYWGLSGLNHLAPGQGIIYKINALTDNVSVKIHKRILAVPYKTEVLKNGDLFMDFGSSNPPLMLTKSGEIKSACD